MSTLVQIKTARAMLRDGCVLAYPTESVYGLGCDPFNQSAVMRLLALKHRSEKSGLILLVSCWDEVATLTQPISDEQRNVVQASWPGPVTWLFPKAPSVPEWIAGQHETIALRMSAHPVAHGLAADGPVVSTSANVTGQPAALSVSDVNTFFSDGVDAIVAGALGGREQPSTIIDVRTQQRIR